jgi:D-alanine-D-alanine ligase
VVVADLEDAANEAVPLEDRHDLEATGPETLARLLETIRSLGLAAHHYKGPAELARNAQRHAGDVVLTIFGGQRSRSRMALVPAVCEAFGLNFVGPDAYGRIIAQDKEISKRLAMESGLLTPAWRVVRDPYDFDSLDPLSLPVVVKPLLEGTSIGIGQRSLQREFQGVKALAEELLAKHRQPVIVEEFIGGREVSYNSIETGAGPLTAFCEVAITERPDYFDSRLLDLDEKFFRKHQRTIVDIGSELASQDRDAIAKFLSFFGRYGYCRVDGKLRGGRFHFIELTPDAWIDPSGQFAAPFLTQGLPYAAIIEFVLASAFVTPPPPSASD